MVSLFLHPNRPSASPFPSLARFTLTFILFLLYALPASAVGDFLPGHRLGLNTEGPKIRQAMSEAPDDRHTVYGSLVYAAAREHSSRLEFVPHSRVKGAVAWGSFLDGAHTISNFGQLRVSTSGEYGDSDQAFAAGYLEGWFTAQRIQQNYKNLYHYFTQTMNASLDGPMKWLNEQDAWVRERCSTQIYSRNTLTLSEEKNNRGEEKRFWHAVCLTMRQFDGLIAGYRAKASRPSSGFSQEEMMTYQDFLFMENNADLYDIIDMMDPTQRPSWIDGDEDNKDNDEKNKALAERLFRRISLSGKCSALVKLAADLSDIFVGHSTWDSYTAMLRIYKHYSFDLWELAPASQQISFSSYPGEVFSDDDFFILSSKLVVTQTTNKIFNDDLFKALTPASVPSWCRVRAANWLADDGESWTRVMRTENSGTYNNQYIIVDLKKFEPGEEPKPGLLWVAEQIPGAVVAKDMTDVLRFGYWPSFNVPYFSEIYNASGYPDFISKVEAHGQHFGKTTHWLSYDGSPRAKIYRRDQAKIATLEDMKAIMRGNDWRKDPVRVVLD